MDKHGRNMVRYQDPRGRVHRLTPTQWHYLETVAQRGRLMYGWGGLKSTLTVRLLEERGLVQLDRRPWERNARGEIIERWEVTGLTMLGGAVHEASVDPDFPHGEIVVSRPIHQQEQDKRDG